MFVKQSCLGMILNVSLPSYHRSLLISMISSIKCSNMVEHEEHEDDLISYGLYYDRNQES